MQNVETFRSWLRARKDVSVLFEILNAFPSSDVLIVGGAVRDWFLNTTTEHTEIDSVVCHVPLDTLIEWLGKRGDVHLVGQTFGVIKFRSEHGNEIDIALPRTEQSLPNSLGGYRDVRTDSNPDLPIEDDLSRRDFTINAMAISLKGGDMIDPFGGLSDLKTRTIRAVGNPYERFQEDLTRVLRGIRFAVQLGFEIEPVTKAAIHAHIPQLNRLKKRDGGHTYVVARELMGEELGKLFYVNPSVGLRLLNELGALEELFPSVWRHTQIDPHYLEPVLQIAPHQLDRFIILLLRDLTPDEIQTTLAYTGLDTAHKKSPYRIDVDRVVWMVHKLQQNLAPEHIQTMRAIHFEKQFLGARGTQHLELLEHLGRDRIAEAAKKRRAEICKRWICEEHEPIPPLVTGEDVLRLGIPAGKQVRTLLDEVRDSQLDGRLLTREAALEWLKKHTSS